MAEANGGDADCVYVTRALLDALERDKRALKWELARAAKAADARAAQLAACEAQVKDLMTIVEMNKSIAHKAVQRNYAKEGVLQRLHRERVALQTRVESQHRLALETLERRVAQRRQREMLHTWTRNAAMRRLRRVALRRVAQSRRRRWLQQGFAQWRQLVRSTTAPSAGKLDTRTLVYPISPHVYSYSVPEKMPLVGTARPTVRFALSPTSSTRSDATDKSFHHADDSRKSLSFSTWKSQWLAQKRRHATAIHFARLMLSKRVLMAWKHVVRRRNWRDAMVKTAIQRRRYQCFDSWATWARRRRRARRLLGKISTRATRRSLQQAFVWLRVRCLEKCMMEWGEVLKDARQAIEEERRIYSLQQNEAMHEIEKKATQERRRQAQFAEAQLEMAQKKQRLEVLTRYMAKWQRLVVLRKMQTRIADQFHRYRKRGRAVQKLFLIWKAKARQCCAVRAFHHRRAVRETRIRVAGAFSILARTTKSLIAQKQALRQILRGRRLLLSSRAFWKWRGAIAVADEQVHALLLQRQLASRLEIRESASQSEGQRLRRVGYKYQMKCALVMGDIKMERHKRKVFNAWKARARMFHNRKQALRKRFASTLNAYVKVAFHRWRAASDHYTEVQQALLERAKRQKSQTLRRTLTAWRTDCQKQITTSAQGSLQFFTLLLWQKRGKELRSRRAVLKTLLTSRLRYRWAKPAFAKWRRKVEVAQLTERRKREREAELLRYTFQRWVVWLARRYRRRKLQFESIAIRAEGQATHRLLKTMWMTWRVQVELRRIQARQEKSILIVARKAQRTQQLNKVWQLWASITRNRIHRRVALMRICKRRMTSEKIDAWHRWKGYTERINGIRAGEALFQRKSRRSLCARHNRLNLHRVFRDWHRRVRVGKQSRLVAEQKLQQRLRDLLRTCLTSWRRHYVPVMQFRRLLIRGIIEARRKACLRIGLQTWRRHSVQLTVERHQQHISARQMHAQSRALVVLRRAWTNRDLRSIFLAWQEYRIQSQRLKRGLKCLVVKKSLALQRVAWRKMVERVVAYSALLKMTKFRIRLTLRRAWYQLYATARGREAQHQVLHRLLSAMKRAIVRSSWTQWKRRDHALLVSKITTAQTATNTMLQAFMDRVGIRQFSKSLLARVFGRWKGHATHQRALRRRVLHLLTRQDSLTVKRCFQSWACELENQRNARRTLFKVLVRRNLAVERLALAKWRTFVVETAYEAKLSDARRQLKAHRQALARRVAMTMFSSWQTPSLSSVFRGWKGIMDAKRRAVNEILERQSRHTKQMILSKWRDAIMSRKIARSTLGAVLYSERRRGMALAWRIWHSRIVWMDTATALIKRLFTSVRLRLLRSGWRLLRLNQDMVMRRQSMMVVVSAQQQLHQQKELQRLRSIAFLLQRQQKGRLREQFLRWKDFASARRERTAMISAVSRRYNRRVARAILRYWRGVIVHKRTQARRIEKWQKTQCQYRLIRSAFRAWDAFAARRYEARLRLQCLLENRAKTLLSKAWALWEEAVEEQTEAARAREIANWRRATTMQQNQVATLEAKTELLLLESVELKRAMTTQRQRCAEAFMRKTLTVLDAAWARQIKARWAQWVLLVDKINVARWLLGKMQTCRERDAFLRWKQETQLRKWTQHEAMMLEKVASILGASSILMHKKKTWKQWVAYAKQRRAKRTQQRVIGMLRRRQGDGTTIRCVFSCWKTFVRDMRQRHLSALRMVTVSRHKLLRWTFRAWEKWRELDRSKREALLMLCRIDRAIQRRSLQHKWLRWRNCMAETAVVVAQSRVVVMESEKPEREEKLVDQTILLRIFTAWRETTTQRHIHRDDMCSQSQEFHALWTKRRVLDGWRRLVDVRKLKQARNQHPVLCVRTHMKKGSHKATPETGELLTFGEYTQHRHRAHWRVQLSRRVTQTRLRRFLGLAWLLRSLRRQHLNIQRRALWRWFAKIQPISCALHAVSFQELPWRRVDVDYAGSMLLLTLEELDLARQTHHTERMQRAWCVVDAIIRSHRRQAKRRAFDKWRWSRQNRPARASGALTTRRPLATADRAIANTEKARARACIAQLTRVQLRRAFSEWKSAYVALAIEQAQAEHQALQEALAQTAMRRRVMDAKVSS